MTTSTSKSPSFTYPATGTYDVQLTVTLPSTHSATVTKTIDVFQLGDVSYTYSTLCNEVTFTDTSIAPNIVSWLWEFGDGTSSSLQNPVHDFPMAFNYQVHLTIKTLNGGIGFTSQNVVITSGTVTADFTNAPIGASVDFTDTSLVDCGAVAWNWDFGDSLGTSSDQNPTYVYLASGTYTVSLTVYDAIGGFDIITHDITVDTSSVWCYDIDFTASDGGFTINSGATGHYSAGVGWIMDDIAGVNQIGIHYDFGSSANVTEIDLTYFNDVTSGFSVAELDTYTGTFTPGVFYETYTHTFTSVSNPTSFNHAFDGTAVDGVNLAIADTNSSDTGMNSIITHATFYGTGTNPFGSDNCVEAGFYWDNNGGTEVQFCDTSTGINTITSWSWDFGDGNTSTSQNPSHIYTTIGTYIVTLDASDGISTGTYTDSSVILTVWSKGNGVVSNGTWSQTKGSWNSSDGWTSEALGADQIIDIDLILPNATEISQLEMYYTEIADNSPGTSFVTRELSTYTLSTDISSHEAHTSTINAAAEDNVYIHTFDGTVVEKVRVQLQITNTASLAKLSIATIKGEHINVFYTPTC